MKTTLLFWCMLFCARIFFLVVNAYTLKKHIFSLIDILALYRYRWTHVPEKPFGFKKSLAFSQKNI